jgi:hypothetical protein
MVLDALIGEAMDQALRIPLAEHHERLFNIMDVLRCNDNPLARALRDRPAVGGVIERSTAELEAATDVVS